MLHFNNVMQKIVNMLKAGDHAVRQKVSDMISEQQCSKMCTSTSNYVLQTFYTKYYIV